MADSQQSKRAKVESAPPASASSEAAGKARVLPSSFAKDFVPSASSSASSSAAAKEPEVVEEEEEEEQVHLGNGVIKIVGLRYYSGIVSRGEMVNLVREPNNKYDANAIRVDNVVGVQVGHVKGTQAAQLAKYMDQGTITFETVLPGDKGVYEMSCNVAFYGPARLHDQFMADMNRAGINFKSMIDQPASSKAAGHGAGAGSSAFGRQSKTLEKVSFAKFSQLSDWNLEHDEAPLAEQPPNIVARLLPHQLKALNWMLRREDATTLAPLWKELPNRTFNHPATSATVASRPAPVQGGLLCDDMGCGKTLEMISVITAVKNSGVRGPTLVICPLSLITVWQEQIDQHLAPGTLSVYVHHGATRKNASRNKDEIASHDVVLTTYGTLLAEYNPSRAAGFWSIDWLRVVTDEAQHFKNPKSKTAKAIFALKKQRAWALTGTPFSNKVGDLYSMLKLVKCGPFDDEEWFRRLITNPMKKRQEAGVLCLKALLNDVCIRRCKESVLKDLPPKTIYIRKLEFSTAEKEHYDSVFARAREQMLEYVEQGTVMSNYSNVLSMLLRLRQISDHPALFCPPPAASQDQAFGLSSASASEPVSSTLTEDEKNHLLSTLRVNLETEDCSICLEALSVADKKPCITACAHCYCSGCLLQLLKASDFNTKNQCACPLCRRDIRAANVVVLPNEDDEEILSGEAGGSASQSSQASSSQPASQSSGSASSARGKRKSASSTNGQGPVVAASSPLAKPDLPDWMRAPSASAKVRALIADIRDAMADGRKGVVFSQFTQFLDCIGDALNEVGIKFARLDGTMKPAERKAQTDRLRSASLEECPVLLCSQRAGGTGLTLTAASSIWLVDPWWSPAVESQCIDRCHRIGQTRNVTAYRYVMTASVEEKVVGIADQKSAMIAACLEEGRREDISQDRLRTLLDIFEISTKASD